MSAVRHRPSGQWQHRTYPVRVSLSHCCSGHLRTRQRPSDAVRGSLVSIKRAPGHIAALGSHPGVVSTLIAETILQGDAWGLDEKAQFLIAHGAGSLIFPLFYGWVITSIMHFVAQQAKRWCDKNPDQPMSTEVIGMLPRALEGPTTVTVWTLVAVRVVRNAAWMLDAFVHTFDKKWNKTVDALVESICSYLVPVDQALMKVYSIIMVAFITVVLVKWKTIALEYFLLTRQQAAAASTSVRGSRPMGTAEDLERLLVPLDGVSSWFAYVAAGLVIAQVLGLNVAPLLAVGGASSIIVGLATQQLLTNTIMGLSLFFTRPFVAGDSVTVQGSGATLTGVVERVTPMRTTLRTEDDILVTVPNKTIADMIVYNRSATINRSRLACASRKNEPLKLKLKVPHAATAQLGELQSAVLDVLGSAVTIDSSMHAGTGAVTTASGSEMETDSRPLKNSSSGSSSSGGSMLNGVYAGKLVKEDSIEIQLSKFTDAGLELLVKGYLCADPSSAAVQSMLLELSTRVRQQGAVLVNL